MLLFFLTIEEPQYDHITINQFLTGLTVKLLH